MFKNFKSVLILLVMFVVGATTVSAYQTEPNSAEKEEKFSVIIAVDGEEAQVEVSSCTVEELLNDKHVVLSNEDSINYGLEEEVFEDMKIEIETYQELIFTETEEIPFETERIPTDELEEGQQRVIQAGVPGESYKRYKVICKGGKGISRDFIEEGINSEPVKEIVEYGVEKNVIITPEGKCLKYTQEYDMKATAYSSLEPGLTDYTYTGRRAVYGVIAVDPTVIPLHSKVYVEGYGEAIAADIGKSIKNYRVDLCFESLEEVVQYGVQYIKVYVLED